MGKKSVYCLMRENPGTKEMDFLSALDQEDCVIHIYNSPAGSLFAPEELLALIEGEGGWEAEEHRLAFFTDVPIFLEGIYRIYHQIFQEFYYFETGCPQGDTYEMEGISREILLHDISGKEHLYKNIYVNQVPEVCTGFQWKKEILEKMQLWEKQIILDLPQDKWKKYYGINGNYFLMEPVVGALTEMIPIDDIKYGTEELRYGYPCFNELVQEVKQFAPIAVYQKSFIRLDDILVKISEERAGYPVFQYRMFLSVLEDICSNCGEKEVLLKIHLLSFLIYETKNSIFLGELLRTALDNNVMLNLYNKYFIWKQLRRTVIVTPQLKDKDGISDLLYEQVEKSFEHKFKPLLTPITKEQRNQDFIVVLAVQFLSENHAPTRTALERCYTLGKLLGKKVHLISTKEQFTKAGMIPLHEFHSSHYIKEYEEQDTYTYRGYTFGFYQPKGRMPNEAEMQGLLLWLREKKPYAVLTIGVGSLLSDLFARVVPVLNIPIVFSTVPKKPGQLTVVGRQIPEEEWKIKSAAGYERETVIESTFTFDLKEQKNKFTRAGIHLPEDKFLLIVVGTRLDAEIDDSFLDAMEKTTEWGTHLVFAGMFSGYEDWCRKKQFLSRHSTYLGFVGDIMALMEICDLYINPYRFGGGFSVTEAFCQGVPGISIRYGDVAAAAGPEFCVENYEEMVQLIKCYMTNEEFYGTMVLKAKERSIELTDSAKAMNAILTEAENRSLFF